MWSSETSRTIEEIEIHEPVRVSISVLLSYVLSFMSDVMLHHYPNTITDRDQLMEYQVYTNLHLLKEIIV